MLFDFATAKSPLSDSLVLSYAPGWNAKSWRPQQARPNCPSCGGEAAVGARCGTCGKA